MKATGILLSLISLFLLFGASRPSAVNMPGKAAFRLAENVLVITHKTQKAKTSKWQFFSVGEEIVFRTKNTRRRQFGQLIGFYGTSLIIKDDFRNTRTVPLQEITRIRKKSMRSSILSTLELFALIGAIFMIAGGAKEKKGAGQNQSNDLDGCMSFFVKLISALLLITLGVFVFVMAIVFISIGKIGTTQSFDLTEDSVWKAEIREITYGELP